MSSNVTTCLSIAVRSVRESMLFDSQNRPKEAFCQYLSNVMYICGVLKDEAWEKELKDCHTPETLKLFKLSSQCLERAQDLLNTAQDNQETPNEPTQSNTPLRKTSQDQGSLLSPGPANVPSNSPMPSPRVVHHTPPASPNLRKISVPLIDEARRGNTQLLSAYRARMERRERQITGSNVRGKTDVTSLNLSLFRKMAENMEIAKARQLSLERKKAERQQRLRELADRRMGPSSLLTTHDQIKKEIYVKVLEFEQESVWLVSLRDQLKSNPEDSSLILHIITKVLGTKEHPLTKCLYSYQVEVRNQLTKISEQARDIITHITKMEITNFRHKEKPEDIQHPEQTQEESDEKISFGEELSEIRELREETNEGAINTAQDSYENVENFLSENQEQEYQKILIDVVNNVQSSLEIVHSLFLLVYEEFSSAAGQDLCLASVEYTFFRPLWPLLLNLYRIANYKKEARLFRIFSENRSCTPAFMNVPGRLCLDEQVATSGSSTSYPYQIVVDELQSLTKFGSPLEKLECIVRTNRVIVECVEDYYESKGKPRNSSETVIGCDDLLPILSYVIIKSQLPQLVSECKAMEDFISEDYLMGEEGYSLTTFQTALAYLESLPDDYDVKPS
ncbi:VPS9 domain-containing protein 1-like isoform X2 [Dendronephthya gigantea]|uniref:VPS9 domain-containing protein 1-like isoform X2 n=1 Tax=Dendronephthya gigantea TaxID=151771 RepID=UPI00106C991F|nr:VPS9 domain-containing protein 1-like isoform X2 [Dendronephthya gigantea]